MFNAKRLFGFLATGVMPEMTALDEAIEQHEKVKGQRSEVRQRNDQDFGVSEELMDEMLAFLRGSGASATTPLSSVRCPLSSTAQDAAPTSLDDHDAQYHPDGYKEGDSCKFREERAKGDGADVGVEEGQRSEVKGQTEELAKSSLSNKKRKEYGDLMRRKHPDVDAEKLLEELGKISDRKLQGDAFRWAMKGCELPRDLEKMKQARELAEKAKVDPLQYDSPQGCIDALTGKVAIKEKPIDPDTVKELSDKQVLPMGVTTYLVQDDAQGQQKMREIINSHWGKDANPWCLLHGDGKGNLEVSGNGNDAVYWWSQYRSLPKRVAFKDGKLLAFMGTKSRTEEWWDRQNKSYYGVPVGYQAIPDDKLGRRGFYQIERGIPHLVGGMLKGKEGEPGFSRWNVTGEQKIAEIDEQGNFIKYHDNGSVESRGIKGRPGYVEYDKDGNKTVEYDDKGRRTEFHKGQVTSEEDENGHYVKFHLNGNLKEAVSDDEKLVVKYDETGRLSRITDFDKGVDVEIFRDGMFLVKPYRTSGLSQEEREPYYANEEDKLKYQSAADYLVTKWRLH